MPVNKTLFVGALVYAAIIAIIFVVCAFIKFPEFIPTTLNIDTLPAGQAIYSPREGIVKNILLTHDSVYRKECHNTGI